MDKIEAFALAVKTFSDTNDVKYVKSYKDGHVFRLIGKEFKSNPDQEIKDLLYIDGNGKFLPFNPIAIDMD